MTAVESDLLRAHVFEEAIDAAFERIERGGANEKSIGAERSRLALELSHLVAAVAAIGQSNPGSRKFANERNGSERLTRRAHGPQFELADLMAALEAKLDD